MTLTLLLTPKKTQKTILQSTVLTIQNKDKKYWKSWKTMSIDNLNPTAIESLTMEHKIDLLLKQLTIDTFRYLHPDPIRFTWKKTNSNKAARLDYFIVSNALTNLISQSNTVIDQINLLLN